MLIFDPEGGRVVVEDAAGRREFPLESPEAFEAVSAAWLRAGWDAKYVYGFSWFGRPVIQLPEDMIRIQEVLYRVKPDVVLETGVAHGGSLVYYASLFQAMGHGRVIGVDVEIRAHNRAAIEAHELAHRITLVEGDAIAPTTVERVKALIAPGEKVLLILDSNHTKAHVLAELRAYADLVAVGSYAVACDGIMGEVVGAPRTRPEWAHDNPKTAAEAFLAERPDFVAEEPPFPFNEGLVRSRVTYWPGAFLRRVR